MESALQDTEKVFVKSEPLEGCVQEPSFEDVSIKSEPSCVKDEPLCENVSVEIEIKLEDVNVKQEPSKTDTAAGYENEDNGPSEPVRGPKPAVKRRIVVVQGQSSKKKPTIYKCAHCKYKTVNLVLFVSHTKTHHDEKSNVKLYKCNHCSFNCTQQDDLLKHKLVHTVKPGDPQTNSKDIKPYKYRYCSDAFIEEVSLQVHEQKRRQLQEPKRPVERPFKCDQCSYTGAHLSHLTQHKACAMHNNVNPYKCSQCEFVCAKKDDLLSHKVIHNDTIELPFKCGECNYATDRIGRLRLHEATHTGEEIHKCSMCSFTTLWKHCLANHESRHVNKRFKCDKCDFGCNREYELKHHERIHTDEKLKQRMKDLRNDQSRQKGSAEQLPAP